MARSGRHGCGRPTLLACVLTVLTVLIPVAARAQIGSDRYSSIVVEASTGNVLEAANPDAPRHPPAR